MKIRLRLWDAEDAAPSKAPEELLSGASQLEGLVQRSERGTNRIHAEETGRMNIAAMAGSGDQQLEAEMDGNPGSKEKKPAEVLESIHNLLEQDKSK